MKKLVLALTAAAAFTGSAMAADMAPRTYSKAPAPVVAVAPSWTGCYLGAGGGGALTTNDHNDYATGTTIAAGPNLTTGARLARYGSGRLRLSVQQLCGRCVRRLRFHERHRDVSTGGTFRPSLFGTQKQDQQWAVGVRAGYLVLPSC